MNITYTIDLNGAKKHIIEVQLQIDSQLKAGQCFWLPDWIPGSYLIRDFSKNIVLIEAFEEQSSVPLVKTGKSTWVLSQDVNKLTVNYKVYAWDLSVRTAHFDEQHCFFNGSSVFLAIRGFEASRHDVTILATDHARELNWKVATSLPVNSVNSFGFGDYYSDNYETLIDHPIEVAALQSCEFICFNTPHRMVFTEAPDNIDLTRIAKDVKAICEYECQFFGEHSPPFEQYLFMTFVTKDGFGGLEHLSSTALHCSYADLPLKGEDSSIKSKGYLKFLSLCCHEYFHSWNVKRIKPAMFKPLELQTERNTELLWFFEGVTSYVDELFLVRSKVISVTDYLDMLAKTISRYYKGKGRLTQTLAESSFDAWTKFYQQDENAANAITSYYVKGALVSLALDFEIRSLSDNELSIDDLMRYLWLHYGKTGKGLAEKGVQKACIQLFSGDTEKEEQLNLFFNNHLYSTKEMNLSNLFNRLGLQFLLVSESKQSDAGGYTTERESLKKNRRSSLSITHKEHPVGAQINTVIDDGAGSNCGLANKDIIIAINGIKVTSKELDSTIQSFQLGSSIEISYFRRDRLYQTNCLLTTSEPNTCYLSFKNGESLSKQNKLLLSWIEAIN